MPWFTVEDIRKSGRKITKTEQHVSKSALSETSLKLMPEKTVLLCCTASVGEFAFAEIALTSNQQFNGLVVKSELKEKLAPEFLFCLASQFKDELIRLSGKTSFNFVSGGVLKTLKIPLPPLEVQNQIVAEIEGYQKIIDGARQVLDNYKPNIAINPDWDLKCLSEITECVSDGDHQAPPKSDGGVPFVTISNIDHQNRLDFTKTFFVPQSYFDALGRTRRPQKNDTLYSVTGSFGIPVFVDSDKQFCFQRHIALIRPAPVVDAKYLYFFMCSPLAFEQAEKSATGVAQKTVALGSLRNFKIPLPDLPTQRAIVAEIEAEQSLVNANRELIRRMEAKVKAAIDRVWGN